MEIKITVTLNQLATARLLGDAQGIILEKLLEEVKTKKQETDVEAKVEEEIIQ